MSDPKIRSNDFKNHCGHLVNTGMKFCPVCGAKVMSKTDAKIEKYKRLLSSIQTMVESNESLENDIKIADKVSLR